MSPKKRAISTPRERPRTLYGINQSVELHHGRVYLNLNYDENNTPFELFITLGRANPCEHANLEAIARLVSLCLRCNISPEEIINQLKGITCEPIWDNGVQVRSNADAVAQVLEKARELYDYVDAGKGEHSNEEGDSGSE